jgi:hypothetical protein
MKKTIGLLLLLSCAPRPDVSCKGERPISCECVRACDFTARPQFDADGSCFPTCWRRDSGARVWP